MSLKDLVSDQPFSYLAMKNGLVQISYKGKTVTTLRGRSAAQFLAKVSTMDSESAQLVMAKTTGHFKHGSERLPRNNKRNR